MRKLIITIVCIMLTLACASAYAENSQGFFHHNDKKAYLVVMALTNTGASSFHFYFHEVENLDVCFDMVKNSKIAIPQGGDAEAAVAMYCTTVKGELGR